MAFLFISPFFIIDLYQQSFLSPISSGFLLSTEYFSTERLFSTEYFFHQIPFLYWTDFLQLPPSLGFTIDIESVANATSP